MRYNDMPVIANDYSKVLIYKIVSRDLNIRDVYVGHTVNFNCRKNKHKSSCYNEKFRSYNYKIYKFIREHGGWDNFQMIEIEKYPCNDNKEAIARERYWFEQLNSTLNSDVPHRSQLDYYVDNIDCMLEKAKNYRNSENGKIKIKEYRNINKDKMKEYRNINKEKASEYSRQYCKKVYTCECGSTLTLTNKTKHDRSIKHQTYVKSDRQEKDINII